VGVAELPPERLRALRPEQAVEGAVDLTRRLRHLELEHVALGHQPVAEVDALDLQGGAVGCDEVLALDADEDIGARRSGEAEDEQQGKEKSHGGTITCGPARVTTEQTALMSPRHAPRFPS